MRMKFIKGDLLEGKNDIVHCVARDGRMGAGVAKVLTSKYPSLRGEFRLNVTSTSEFVPIDVGDKVIYNLVTKELSNGKPTLNSLEDSLLGLREYLLAVNIREVDMPLIGSGLDRLHWVQVMNSFKDIMEGALDLVNVYYINYDVLGVYRHSHCDKCARDIFVWDVPKDKGYSICSNCGSLNQL